MVDILRGRTSAVSTTTSDPGQKSALSPDRVDRVLFWFSVQYQWASEGNRLSWLASSGKEAVCSHAKAAGSPAKVALCSTGLTGERHESCVFRRQAWGRQEPREPCLWIGLVARTSLSSAVVVQVAGCFLVPALPLLQWFWTLEAV